MRGVFSKKKNLYEDPRILQKVDHVKDFQSRLKDIRGVEKNWEKKLTAFTQEEIILGRQLEKYRKLYEVEEFMASEVGSTKKKRRNLTAHEIRKNEHLSYFYGKFGACVVSVATKRRQMESKVGRGLQDLFRVGESRLKEMDTKYAEYQKIMNVFEDCRERVESREKSLSRAEKKAQETQEMKKKQKKKAEEKRKAEMLEKELKELEKLQKLAMYEEQRTIDALRHQCDKLDVEFSNSLLDILGEFKNFYESSFQQVAKLEKELQVRDRAKKFKMSPEKENVEIGEIRNEFLPVSMKRIFGEEVDEIMSRPNETGEIPHGVQLLMSYVEERKDLEGIFRKAGKKEMIETYRRHLDVGNLSTFDEAKNPYTISVLLKDYIRSLPDQFAPYTDFRPIMELQSDDEKVDFVRDVWLKMTSGRKLLFYRLFQHFKVISDNSAKNLMKPNNIAICMASNIFKNPDLNDPRKLKDYAKTSAEMQNVFVFVLENFDAIFQEKPYVKFEKKKMEVPKSFIHKLRTNVLGGKSVIDVEEEEKHIKRNVMDFLTTPLPSGSQEAPELGSREKSELMTRSLKLPRVPASFAGQMRPPKGNRPFVPPKLPAGPPPAPPKGGYRKRLPPKPPVGAGKAGRSKPQSRSVLQPLRELEVIDELSEHLTDFVAVNDSPLTSLCTLGRQCVVTGDSAGNARVWTVGPNGLLPECHQVFYGDSGDPIVLVECINAESKIFLTSSEGKSVKVWKLGVHRAIKEWKFDTVVRRAMVHDDLDVFVLVVGNKLISIDRSSLTIKVKYDVKHESEIVACFYSFGSMYTASESDGFMLKWDVDSPEPVSRMEVKKEKINAATPSTSKKTKVVSCLESGKYVSWKSLKSPTIIDTFKKKKIKKIFELNPKKDYFILVFELPKHDLVSLAIGYCGLVSSFKTVNPNTHIVDIKKYGDLVDNRYLYWDLNHTICLCNQTVVKKKLTGHKDTITGVVQFFEGKLLASCSKDGTVRVWQVS